MLMFKYFSRYCSYSKMYSHKQLLIVRRYLITGFFNKHFKMSFHLFHMGIYLSLHIQFFLLICIQFVLLLLVLVSVSIQFYFVSIFFRNAGSSASFTYFGVGHFSDQFFRTPNSNCSLVCTGISIDYRTFISMIKVALASEMATHIHPITPI